MPTPTPNPRARHSTTRPPSTRRSRPQAQRERSQTPPLPAYEPPLTPLHPAGQAALLSLLKSQSLRQLKTHIQHAEEKLTDSAGEVNERLTEARARLKRKREVNKADEEGGDEEEERLKRFGEEVGGLTGRLEERMRGVIDGEWRVDGLVRCLGEMEREVEAASVVPRGRGGRRRRRGVDGDGDDEDDEDYEEEGRGEMLPTKMLDEVLGEKYAEWDGLSLTQRYSANNAYIGFYRIIHEAKHPGDDIPPLPHASTWFSHIEEPASASAQATDFAARRTRRRKSSSPADSDEIAIESERISLKCPLTLLYFKDPVTSTKCPHSFEREPIEEMIAQSPTTVPAPQSAGAAGRSARRVRSAKCPVCSVILTAADLRPDPALVRRVRRHQQALEREAEEDELSVGARRRLSGVRKGGITLASDDSSEDGDEDEMDVDSHGQHGGHNSGTQYPVRIKQEMSTAPVDDD